MPLFLDRHYVEGIREDQVLIAHEKDLAMQSEYDVQFLTYWFDEGRHTTFCLVLADSADLISTIHAKAHGSIPNDIAEVDRLILSDAQTSGGLLIAVPPDRESDLIGELERNDAPAGAVIGELVPGEPGSIEVASE